MILPDIINPKHFAELLGVTTQTINAMSRNGKLPPISNRNSRNLRWYKNTVLFWLDNNKPNRDEFRRLWSKKNNS